MKRPRPRPGVATPEPEPPALPATAWNQQRCRSPQHMSFNVRQIVDAAASGNFLLPTFQRDYVWTDAQVIRLFDSLRLGYHVGSLLLWERYQTPREIEIGGLHAMSAARVMVVLDGHQRLASIVRAATSERFSFDLLSGQLVVDAEPGPWIVPAHAVIRMSYNWLFDNAPAHAARWGIDPRAWQLLIAKLNGVFERVYVSAVRLESDYDLGAVIEMYRRLNTEGTRHSADDLERALATVQKDAA